MAESPNGKKKGWKPDFKDFIPIKVHVTPCGCAGVYGRFAPFCDGAAADDAAADDDGTFLGSFFDFMIFRHFFDMYFDIFR